MMNTRLLDGAVYVSTKNGTHLSSEKTPASSLTIYVLINISAPAFRWRGHHVFWSPIHPSDRSAITQVTDKPKVHPSWEVSGHFLENAWKERPTKIVCWCILTTFRTDFNFNCNFDIVERAKFGVSGHFLENAWNEWSEICHTDVS